MPVNLRIRASELHLSHIRTPFRSNRPFDAIWARFILEYFRKEQCEVVANSITSLRGRRDRLLS